jgi:sugar lactone lactonase YvrE
MSDVYASRRNSHCAAHGPRLANGVALAPDESFLLVAETIGYRILKFWLKGPRAGQWVEFVTGTPGFPDNISLSESGLVRVSLPAPRVRYWISCSPGTRFCGSWRTGFRNGCNPRQAEDVVWVRAYHPDGKLVHDIRTKHPRLSFITAVAESGGTVCLASAHHDVLGRIGLSQDRERFPILGRTEERKF